MEILQSPTSSEWIFRTFISQQLAKTLLLLFVFDKAEVTFFTRETENSHPRKIVTKHWYDRNKHIFPSSRWEIFDFNKTFDTYTAHGHEVHGKS